MKDRDVRKLLKVLQLWKVYEKKNLTFDLLYPSKTQN